MPRERPLHDWTVSPREATAIQRRLAGRVARSGTLRAPRWIAGADLCFTPDRTQGIAGVVVWDLTERRVVEQRTARRPVTFPYVPGLLSFREAPALLAAIHKLEHRPDVFMFDGHGVAHPRRFGLACHLGVWLDRPTLGCGKSLLVGEHRVPGRGKGQSTPLRHQGERIGTVLRTRTDVKPVFVSVGHRLSLAQAVKLVLVCCERFRLPEPTRLADQLVSREKSRSLKAT